MKEFWHEITPHMPLAALLSTTIQRLLLAAFLGALIGLEREAKHKPAGLRTNMFICFGSAMFTILSMQMVDPSAADKSRIAANIITGIGFIGAGSIMHSRGGVQGLTTAATLFVVASIGMAAGGGFYLEAIFATIIILLSLHFLGWVETRFNLKPIMVTYEAIGARADHLMSEINEVLEEEHRIMESVQVGQRNGGFAVQFKLDATRSEHRQLLDKFRQQPSLRSI